MTVGSEQPCGHGWHFGGPCDSPKRPTIGDRLVERDELLSILRELVLTFGPWHADDCPGDDTCSCSAKPLHDRINAALAK